MFTSSVLIEKTADLFSERTCVCVSGNKEMCNINASFSRSSQTITKAWNEECKLHNSIHPAFVSCLSAALQLLDIGYFEETIHFKTLI